MEGEYVGSITRRGLTVPVFKGEGRFFAILAGKSVFVCRDFENWEISLKGRIDSWFGEIREISPGFDLRRFDNGGHEDVGLFRESRILKVWLCAKEPSEADLRRVEAEAERIVGEIRGISLSSARERSLNYTESEILEISADPQGGSD